MPVLGVGAATPLVLIGLISRQALGRLRRRMLAAGSVGKYLIGGVMVVLGLLILAGADKALEPWLVDISPLWPTQLTTRY